VKLTTSVAGAGARPSQYLYNIITFKSREWDKVHFFIYQYQQAVVA